VTDSAAGTKRGYVMSNPWGLPVPSRCPRCHRPLLYGAKIEVRNEPVDGCVGGVAYHYPECPR
jgi:hypothetical protein